VWFVVVLLGLCCGLWWCCGCGVVVVWRCCGGVVLALESTESLVCCAEGFVVSWCSCCSVVDVLWFC